MTTAIIDLAANDCDLALDRLQPHIGCWQRGDTRVVKLSDNHYAVVSPDDGRASDLWATSKIPSDGSWVVEFDTVGTAVIRHFFAF